MILWPSEPGQGSSRHTRKKPALISLTPRHCQIPSFRSLIIPLRMIFSFSVYWYIFKDFASVSGPQISWNCQQLHTVKVLDTPIGSLRIVLRFVHRSLDASQLFISPLARNLRWHFVMIGTQSNSWRSIHQFSDTYDKKPCPYKPLKWARSGAAFVCDSIHKASHFSFIFSPFHPPVSLIPQLFLIFNFRFMANLDHNIAVEPSIHATSTSEEPSSDSGPFSAGQLARIRSFFPALEAKILEVDPEFKGHCSDLTAWKKNVADQLLSTELFSNLVDTQNGKTQKRSRKVCSIVQFR